MGKPIKLSFSKPGFPGWRGASIDSEWNKIFLPSRTEMPSQLNFLGKGALPFFFDRGKGPPLRRFLFAWGFFLFGGYGGLSAAPLSINPGDENASIQNDLFSDAVPPARMAVGDFDGNGIDDIAIDRQEQREILLVLNPAPGISLFSNVRTMRITATPASANGTQLSVSHFIFADLNGDSRKDLVISIQDRGAANEGRVEVVLGQPDPPATLDLTLTAPDLRITGKTGDRLGSTFAAGDFAGNAVQDLFIGAAGTGGGYVLEGSSALATGFLDLGVSPLPRIQGAGVGWDSVQGDFDGDGKDDLALSVSDASVGGKTRNGEIYLVSGRATFPPLLSLAVSTASVHLWGATSSPNFMGGLVAVAAGDLSGDGKSDLLFGTDSSTNVNPETVRFVRQIFALNVAEAPLANGAIDLASPLVSTTAVVPYYFPGYRPETVRLGDFDGDAKTDFVHMTDGSLPHTYRVNERLTSLVGSGLSHFQYIGNSDWSVQWNGYWSSLASGDVNSDGVTDLVAYEAVYPGYSPSSLNFLYGFRPLTHPTIRVRERTPHGLRVTLDLYADGVPTEVYLSGALAAEDQGRWRLFQSVMSVSLSPEKGEKTIQALYRNAFGRQSETCSDTVSFAVDQTKTEPFTNILSPGGQVSVNCSLTESSQVKAEVYDREGTVIAVLLDETRGPGVWPVVWDGKNAAGQKVAPGLFMIVVKVNGHADIHKILVQG